jgi:hypothetical protein
MELVAGTELAEHHGLGEDRSGKGLWRGSERAEPWVVDWWPLTNEDHCDG